MFARVWKVFTIVLLACTWAGCAPKDPKPFMESAKAKFAATNFQGALDDYTLALRAAPKNVEALKGRAMAKFRLGEINAALFDFNAALSIAPKNQEALIGRALTYALMDNVTNANADFVTLTTLDPTNAAKAKFTIGQAILRRGRFKSANSNEVSAIKDYDTVIALFPDVGVAYHERGAAKLALRRYKQAIEDFDLAVKHDAWHNEFGDSFLLRAKAKRALNDTNGAAIDEAEGKRRGEAGGARLRGKLPGE